MMPHLSAGWQWLVLTLSLAGFACLALTREREGATLLGHPPSPGLRQGLHALGWPLLAVALGVCMLNWHASFGTVLWFGWLTVAALGLVFAIAYWPWRSKATPAARRRVAAEQETRLPWAVRSVLALALIGIPLALGWSLSQAPVHPLSRADAIEIQVGPWPLRLAEDRRGPPTLTPQGIPIKVWHLRWLCEGCERDIDAAYLKVHRPRSSRNYGSVFTGPHWDRQAGIQLPANVTAENELWLTVVGRDGSVHQASWRMDEVSPGTVAWFAAREGK